MSVKRRVNWISQQRVDVPDMRALESAASNDFDELIQSFVTGTSQGYILRGFEFSMAGAIGGAASGLQMLVDPGAIFHVTSSQSGTFLLVPAGTPPQQLNSATNTIVDGAFAPSAINYVGIEYERFIDDTTSSQVYLWNPTTNNETTKNAPRAQILRYRIKITTSTFATNVLPIATVTTDSGNNVVSITDARWMLFRLGQGGTAPNPFYNYPWTAQPEGRLENPSTSSSNGVNPFHGGDKMLMTLKDWMNAIMSALREIKGTTYWYELGTAGSIDSLRTDLGNTLTTGKGVIEHSADVAGLITWDEDIFMKVIGSRLEYKITANPTPSTDVTLADNQVAYINLVRGVEITPNLIFTNGSAIVQSVGSIAWTGPLQAGDWVKLAADTDAFLYQIQSVDSLSQVTLTIPFAGVSTGAPGAKGKYSFGTYSASPSPSTDRDIFIVDREDVPAGQNVWWLLLRADNGGAIPRVYVRFIGAELEQGESEEIDDGVPRQLLQYIGSPLESASRPQYVSALNPGSVPEITDITCGTAASMSSNQYFFINSSGNNRKYYVWVNKDGTGVDPAPLAGYIGIEWVVSTGQTDAQVATALAAALNGTDADDFTAAPRPNPNQHIVRNTNNSAGVTDDASNFDVGVPFAISVFQQGTGVGNAVIQDGDNLTLAIKKLDQAIGQVLAAADDPNYDEPLIVISSVPSDTNHVQGPISAGSNLTLPNNSRAGDVPQSYTVGLGRLEIYLNGQFLPLNLAGGSVISVASNAVAPAQSSSSAPSEWLAQSFQATSAGNLETVTFRAKTDFGPVSGLIYVELQSDDGGGLPSGTVLATSDSYDTSGLTLAFQDIVFTFPGYSLATLTTYHLVIVFSGVTYGGNQINMQSSNITNPYPDGQCSGSVTSGATWFPLAAGAIDLWFDVEANTGDPGITDGWEEVGADGTLSDEITIWQNLVVGDIIEFRFGVGGGGGGEVGPVGPAGPAGPPGSDAVGGPIAISTKSASYTVLLTDNILKGDATGGSFTLTLPPAATATGRVFWFKKIDASANPVVVQADGLELIDGVNTQSLVVQFESFILVSDGTTWSIF